MRYLPNHSQRRYGCPPYALRNEQARPGYRRERIAALWPKRHRPTIRLVIQMYLGSLRQHP